MSWTGRVPASPHCSTRSNKGRSRTRKGLVRCLALPRQEFFALLNSEPGLTRAMLDEVARRLVVAEQ